MLDARSMQALAGSDAGAARTLARFGVVALLAFLTVVDLFATQAILPALTHHYGVTPTAMALAVNATTFGMAAAGLAVALFGRLIDRKTGVVASLCLLAVPTLLLAAAPNLAVFAALRVAQGLCMATAFGLTLAYIGERHMAHDAAIAFAAYITGNVASNLFGRMISAGVADHAGLAANFTVFAALNLAGAALAHAVIDRLPPMGAATTAPGWRAHLRDPKLRAGFGIGFCILFAFIGVFTFVNFVLTEPPLSLGMMSVGLVYLVFLPSIVTTPLAGLLAERIGRRSALWTGLAVAGVGLPLLVTPNLVVVLAGMVLVGVGTFLAQAVATGFVSHAAMTDRAAASGVYLASYFIGGLAGTAALGWLFDRFGWPACVMGVGAALAAAALLARRVD